MLIYLNEFETGKQSGKSHRLYKCECEFCHKIVKVPKFRMKTNKSCGCLSHINTKDFVFYDIKYTGNFEPYKNFGQRLYIGICKCGNIVKTHTSQLKKKKSCGCVKYKNGRNKQYLKVSKYFAESFLILFKVAAKRRGIDFNITLDDLDTQLEKQNGKCFYTGIELTTPKTPDDCYKNKSSYNISIDRIDSLKSYTKDNIQLVLKDINKMKLNHSSEIFIEYCHRVSRNFN